MIWGNLAMKHLDVPIVFFLTRGTVKVIGKRMNRHREEFGTTAHADAHG